MKKISAPIASRPPESAVRVHQVRGERVVLDYDVAALFLVETRKLNQQVSRNKDKFGDDFAFRLSAEEFDDLRSQDVISSPDWGGTRYRPIAFTEHGVVMVATVLKSPKAIQATRVIVRTFVEARREAWERENLKLKGQLPLALDVPVRQGLMTKLNIALGHVLDAIIDPKDEAKAQNEAQAIANEAIKSIKAYLKKAGIENEKTLAEVRKIMAEAESIEVATAGKRTENKHRQLALVAKQIRLIIQAQLYAETGSVEGLMQVLGDLERP